MASIIQVRHDTAANWTSVNPILAQGELGLETDTSKFKFGNGVTAWNLLSYSGIGSGDGFMNDTLYNYLFTSVMDENSTTLAWDENNIIICIDEGQN
jgi:hypothetical protein